MNYVTPAQVSCETLLAVAHLFPPESAIFLVLLGLQDQEARLRATLRDLAAYARLESTETAAALQGLAEQKLIDFRPAPNPEVLDEILQIVVTRVPGNVRSFDSQKPEDRNAANVGSDTAKESPEAWSLRAATALGDRENLACYRSFAAKHSRDVLERALAVARDYPEERIRSSRGALFVSLVKSFSSGSTHKN